MTINILYLLALPAPFIATAFLLYCGRQSARRIAAASGHSFRISSTAFAIGWGLVPALSLAVLPFIFPPARLGSMLDALILWALVSGFVLGVAELLNRRVAFSADAVLCISWTGRLKALRFGEVQRVSFHNYYGGFFLLHGADTRLYVPVLVDDPVRLLDLLERSIPAAALRPASRGIALCRLSLNR